MRISKEALLITGILLVSFFLNIYGINWGLPARWNVDQPVTTALNMLKDKSIFPQDYFEPSLYYYVLIMICAPFLLISMLFNKEFLSIIADAKISWNLMALHHPDVASHIFMIARFSSVLFSLASVFVTYRLAKKIGGARVGLFAALALALTMDFVNWAHMDKSIALVNLLSLLAVYYLVILYSNNHYMRKTFLLACLFAGLASSTKFNGMLTISVVPLAVWKMKPGSGSGLKNGFFCAREIFLGLSVFLGTFVLTSPALIFKSRLFFLNSIQTRRETFFMNGLFDTLKIWLPNMARILQTFTDMLGIPLFLLAAAALVYCLRLFNKPAIRILYFFIFCLVLFFSFNKRVFISPDSKFFIQTVPYLSVLSALFINDLLGGDVFSGTKRRVKIIIIFLVFSTSFIYCLSLGEIFANSDVRYQATKWFLDHNNERNNIIINTQLEYALGIDVLRHHDVYVLGGKPGTKHAYFFKDGRYFLMSESIFKSIRAGKGFSFAYVVVPYWGFKSGKSYASAKIEAAGKKLSLAKRFERKNPWYWNPGIGGYEPAGIELYIMEDAR